MRCEKNIDDAIDDFSKGDFRKYIRALKTNQNYKIIRNKNNEKETKIKQIEEKVQKYVAKKIKMFSSLTKGELLEEEPKNRIGKCQINDFWLM